MNPDDNEDPVDYDRPFLRPVRDSQFRGEDGDVLDYVAATVQNGAQRRPPDGCWSGSYTYEEIRGGWWW